jgi:hypothetical protein
MPYSNPKDAVEAHPNLKKYSDKAVRGFVASFNSSETNGHSEKECFAIAYSVANKVDKKTAALKEEILSEENMTGVKPIVIEIPEEIQKDLKKQFNVEKTIQLTVDPKYFGKLTVGNIVSVPFYDKPLEIVAIKSVTDIDMTIYDDPEEENAVESFAKTHEIITLRAVKENVGSIFLKESIEVSNIGIISCGGHLKVEPPRIGEDLNQYIKRLEDIILILSTFADQVKGFENNGNSASETPEERDNRELQLQTLIYNEIRQQCLDLNVDQVSEIALLRIGELITKKAIYIGRGIGPFANKPLLLGFYDKNIYTFDKYMSRIIINTCLIKNLIFWAKQYIDEVKNSMNINK